MPLITLTSDMGTQDHYVAVVKAAIYQHLPVATVIDISHHVRPFDIGHAAFLMRGCFKDFPKGTVHILGVNPDRTAICNHLAVLFNGQYFIGADNGFFSLVFGELPQKMVNLDHVASNVGETQFPMRDIFCMAACHLAKGGTMEVLGKEVLKVNSTTQYLPIVEERALRGVAMHIDGFGNVISNIDRKLFDLVRRDRVFEIRFRKNQQRTRKLCKTYSDVEFTEIAALFGSSGFLEIGINGGNASQLLGIKPNDTISVEFL
jgi:S-adenosylmethionine hydrolase